MKVLKRIITLMLIISIIATVCVFSTVSSAAQGTGVGLSEWALNAYNSGWEYVYGGASAGAVDCSGLIYSYVQTERCGDPQLYASPESDSLSTLPNIHGLGLWQPGHVGVYVGSGMAVDARNESAGVCYESVYSHGWTYWFKINGVSYPTEGWQVCNGEYFYYEDGEYITDTSRTIDGTTYYFDSTGVSSTTPDDVTLVADDSNDDSSSKSSSSSSSSSSALRLGSTGDRVIELQERLSELGYYTGPIDGDFGNGTEQAFKDFQTAVGLTPDGIAGSDIEYLFADDAPAKSTSNEDDEDIADTGAQEDENTEDVEEVEEADEEAEPVKDIEEPKTSSFAKGDYSDEIAVIQERLISLGYFAGDIDGSFGSNTESAVIAFQEANGLETTGIVDEETYNLLFSEDAKELPTEEETQAPTEETVKETQKPTQKIAAGSTAKPSNTENIKETVKPTEQTSTEIELQTNELSSKALSSLASKLGINAKNGNFSFLFWLAAVIVLLSIALVVVYIIEKKRKKAVSGRHQSK